MSSTSGQPYRWAVVGTGYLASTVMPDLQAAQGVTVHTVVSRTLDRAQSFATEWGIPNAVDNLFDVLADPDVDLVYVCTPVSTHFDVAKSALLAGKHVLVEKPFALNESEARELVRIAQVQRRFLMEAMWMRFNPTVREVSQLVADGLLGDIQVVTTEFGRRLPAEHNAWQAELGGGALLDLGPYSVAFTHHFLGSAPREIVAHGTASEDRFDTFEVATFDYGNTRFAQLTCSMLAWLPPRATVSGTLGAVSIDRFMNPHGYTLTIGDEVSHHDVPIQGAGYIPMFEAVVHALEEGATESGEHTLADAVAAMTTIDAIRSQVGADLGERTPIA